MSKFAVAFLLCLTSAVVNAQLTVSRDVICDKTEVVVTVLTKDYNERPVWVGRGEGPTSYMLLINPETKSWSMVHLSTDVSCIVGSGQGVISLGSSRKPAT